MLSTQTPTDDSDAPEPSADVVKPEGYDGSDAWGLFLFLSSTDEGAWFRRYEPILAKHRLLLAAPWDAGNEWGTPRRIELALARVRDRGLRWAFMTGDQDFNHGHILSTAPTWLDMGFDARVFDVPGMPHDLSAPPELPDWLDAAFQWLEGREVQGAATAVRHVRG